MKYPKYFKFENWETFRANNEIWENVIFKAWWREISEAEYNKINNN